MLGLGLWMMGAALAQDPVGGERPEPETVGGERPEGETVGGERTDDAPPAPEAAPVPDAPEPPPAPVAPMADASTEKPEHIQIGVGAYFNAGGSFMTEADDRNVDGFIVPSSGFAGFSPGVGTMIDISYRGIVGVEVGFVNAWQNGLSEFSIDNLEFQYQVKQQAFHVPVLLKLGAPLPTIRPNIVVGREFVMPRNGEIVARNDFPTPVEMSAQASAYQLWMFGLGFEVKLPTEAVDLRIPLNFRGSLQPGYSQVASERNVYDLQGNGLLNSVTWGTEFQYHAAIQLGMAIYFP